MWSHNNDNNLPVFCKLTILWSECPLRWPRIFWTRLMVVFAYSSSRFLFCSHPISSCVPICRQPKIFLRIFLSQTRSRSWTAIYLCSSCQLFRFYEILESVKVSVSKPNFLKQKIFSKPCPTKTRHKRNIFWLSVHGSTFYSNKTPTN